MSEHDAAPVDKQALKQMFEARDDAYVAATQHIVDAIGPTVLEALYTVFNVPVDDVKWLDFSSTENLLIIVCSIAYNPHDSIPEFLEDTMDNIPDVDEVVEQTVRIGIPYELVFKDAEEIVAFLDALVDSHIQGGPSLIQHNPSAHVITEPSDPTPPVRERELIAEPQVQLNEEQRQQMVLFGMMTKGKVH